MLESDIMTKERKDELLKLLTSEVVRRKEELTRAQLLAKDFAEQSRSSWSIGGDRAHAEAAVSLAQKFLDDTKSLLEETSSVSEEAKVTVSPPCFVKLPNQQFHLVSKNLKLPGVLLVTPEAPLGKAVLGKHVGDKADSWGEILEID